MTRSQYLRRMNKPIQLHPGMEKQRKKLVQQIRRNRDAMLNIHKIEDTTLRAEIKGTLSEEYKILKKDLVEFDSLYLDGKYREQEDSETESGTIYVCLNNGKAYRSKTTAIRISKMTRSQFEKELLSDSANWRIVQEKYTIPKLKGKEYAKIIPHLM